MNTIRVFGPWLIASYLAHPTAVIGCPKYDRDSQYGDFKHWGDCQDTRAKVLIRDNTGHLTFRDSKTCVVDSGLWIDPYSGDTLFAATALQIDHVVPLKEAHISGAWAWTQEKRKSYTNFLDSTYHLLAVKGSLNSSKGDRDPAEWLPPNKAFIHEYALDWVKIKVHWGLKADPKEISVLRSLLPGENIQYPEEASEDVCTDGPTSLAKYKPVFNQRYFGQLNWDLTGRFLDRVVGPSMKIVP